MFDIGFSIMTNSEDDSVNLILGSGQFARPFTENRSCNFKSFKSHAAASVKFQRLKTQILRKSHSYQLSCFNRPFLRDQHYTYAFLVMGALR